MRSWLLIACVGFQVSGYASSASEIIHILDDIYGTELSQLTDLENISQIESSIQTLSQSQLDNLVSQLNAITGHYGYGNLFNDDEAKQAQTWSPDSWEDAISSEGGATNQQYQSLLDAYQQNHPSLSTEEMRLGADETYTSDYQQMVAVNQAANVQSTYEFNDINQHLHTIQALTDDIEEANDEKAIADLNARINAEAAYLSVEAIKMLSVLNQQYAQSVASQIVDRNQASIFNRFPNDEENPS